MSKYKIMTPGPVQVPENVRLARSLSTTNADLDPQFYDEYKETCELISELLHTKNETLILSGEGILGLEAACASITEPGDRVLIMEFMEQDLQILYLCMVELLLCIQKIIKMHLMLMN